MKNTMKKIGLLLAIAIMTVLCAVSASAEKWGDYSYIVLDDGTVTITEYTGNATELTIPSQINGRVVTSIGDDAFSDCINLKIVTIPNSVINMGQRAFADCEKLEYIEIPESFNGTMNLAPNVFYGTPFYENYGEWIECYYVVDGCAVDMDRSKLTSTEIYIPSEIRAINPGVFDWEPPFIKAFVVDENNPYFSSDEYGVLYNKNKTKLIAYPVASIEKEYIIPETVNSIEDFSSLYLESIIIPNSVKKISAMCGLAFENVYIYGKNTAIPDIDYLGRALCSFEIDHKAWMDVKDEFSTLVEINITKFLNGTATEEELNTFQARYEEIWGNVFLYDPVSYGTIHCYPGSTAETYAKSKGINYQYIIDDIKEKDETTGITAVFAPGTFDSGVEMTIVESSTNADIAFKKLFGTYKSYDITFNSNGVEVQPNGKVTIKIPLTFVVDLMAIKVYHVDENGTATLINSNVENGYVVFEAEHFSEYVIVDTSDKHEHSYEGEITIPATHTTEGVMTYTCSCDDAYTEAITKDPNHNYISNIIVPTCTMQGYTTYTCSCGDSYIADYVNALEHKDANSDGFCDNCLIELLIKNCDCNCHATGFKRLFFKLINFFQKLFGMNKVCACGVKH